MWLPEITAVGIPWLLASLAAFSLVAMPPVPRLEPAPPASSSTAGVISSTRGMRRAWGFFRGSLSYRPSMSVRMMSPWAPHSPATTAERVSLSPKFLPSSSWVSTVSFSFTTGMTPMESSSRKVFCTFSRPRGKSTTSAVSSTWATVWSYSPKNLS